MAKGHRSQIKRERNENQKDTRPSAKLSKICVKRHFEIITVRSCKCGEQQWYESSRFIH